VPALKAARVGIAQGSGSQMARAVADLVLVRGDFASVPALVAEGRKVLRNLQRVSKLFVSKSAFATFLILSIGLTPQPYPLLPRQLSVAGALTLGIPAFFLALAPSEGRYRSERFLFDVGRFAVPAGTAAGLGVLASFIFARNVARLPLDEARTIATTVVVLVGLYLILALEATSRRRATAVGSLVLLMIGVYALLLAFAGVRDFFALTAPGAGGVVISLAGAALAIAGLWLTDDRFVPGVVRESTSPNRSVPRCRPARMRRGLRVPTGEEKEMTAMLPELASVHLRETERELVIEVEMPPEVDLSRVVARLVDGVLEITLPRTERAQHIPGFHPDACGV
jgi:magnesium-transporting ATPase (P-type)